MGNPKLLNVDLHTFIMDLDKNHVYNIAKH